MYRIHRNQPGQNKGQEVLGTRKKADVGAEMGTENIEICLESERRGEVARGKSGKVLRTHILCLGDRVKEFGLSPKYQKICLKQE